MRFYFLIFSAVFFDATTFSQDTLWLSSPYFSLGSCYLDSLGKSELAKIIWKSKKYKIHYTEYVIKKTSAHYCHCRTKELELNLKRNFDLTITSVENVVLPTSQKKKKGQPAFSEIYLVRED